MKASWRTRAQSVIAETLKAHPTATGKELKRILREAYPFGERAMHPYKVWCEEVKAAIARVEGKAAALEAKDEPPEILTLKGD